MRGEVKDESGTLLKNAKILLHSNGYLYFSGSSGTFGIQIPAATDSLTISAADFQTVTVQLDARSYQSVTLKKLFPDLSPQKKGLLSATKNLKSADWHGWTVGSETYNSLLENEAIPADKFPETGFAVNTDKASYSNVRRFLNMGIVVPPDAIRIEEMLNYFNFNYSPPSKDSMFSIESHLSACPWHPGNQLMFIHGSARKIDFDKVPPANLVFLIDVSGSMDLPNRLPLLKSAFRLLVNNLRKKDTISMVIYGNSVAVWLPPTPGDQKDEILKAIEDLNPGGSTPGAAGIRAAYTLASNQFIRGGNNRVILATDGDFNVGENTEEELERLIVTHKHWGIYLTCLGVGMGNYKDSKLQILAQRGSGNFAYLDDAKEAEKVLMYEFTQTMYAVADDAFVNIEFKPSLVKDYRLIGFDNKLTLLSDSTSMLQGGEIGSGHSFTALFEITPADTFAHNNVSFADIKLQYKKPNDSVIHFSNFECLANLTPFDSLSPSLRFASSIAMFGGLLKKSKYMSQVSWGDVQSIALLSQDPQDALQKEFITLIEKAKKIYNRDKRKRKK